MNETWDCGVCEKTVKQSRVWACSGCGFLEAQCICDLGDEQLKEVFGDSNLADPNNLFNPDSRYWNVVHKMVFCGAVDSLVAHEKGYQI